VYLNWKKQDGQAVIIVISAIGVIMAALVFFGFEKSGQFQKQVSRLENNLMVADIFGDAIKKIQGLYSNEAGCDPSRLNTIIANWPVLPSAYATGIAWILANPAESTVARRQGLCSGGIGCRQLGVTMGGRGYIVNVGQIDFGADASTTGGSIDTAGACSRDTSLNLRMTIMGTSFSQHFTLINTCSTKSCTGPSFDSADANVATATKSTVACTAANGTAIPSRKYGDYILDSVGNFVTADELRWARRFLSTGGTNQGITEFLYTTSEPTSGNATCDVSLSSGQCIGGKCVPALDLNMDGTNNETDIGILELFLRGFINKLPVKDF